MVNKKTIVTVVLVGIFALTLSAPVFAQQQGQGNPGFFGMFAQFFSRVFSGQNPQGQNGNMPTGMPEGMNGTPMPSGMMMQMESNRLQGLVTAGKITASQEQQIIAETTSINKEIQVWSKSTGINAGYVYGALRGPGMDAGIGGGQGWTNGATPNPFMRPQGGIYQGGINQGVGAGAPQGSPNTGSVGTEHGVMAPGTPR